MLRVCPAARAPGLVDETSATLSGRTKHENAILPRANSRAIPAGGVHVRPERKEVRAPALELNRAGRFYQELETVCHALLALSAIGAIFYSIAMFLHPD
jgi:hypothetical protein